MALVERLDIKMVARCLLTSLVQFIWMGILG